MSNKSREEEFSERERRSCSVIVKESDDNSNNDNKREKNNNNKNADLKTWTSNVNNKIIDNTTLNDEGNHVDNEKKWWQTLCQIICFTRPENMPLWFEMLLFGLLSACFLFFPWSSNPIHILFIALSFFFAIILCTVYLVLLRITLHRARRAAEQEWDEYHFKAEESINSLANSLDAVNNHTTRNYIKIYDNDNNEGRLNNNTASTHIPLLPQPPPPPPVVINLEFEENVKLRNNEQRALAHFINNKYTHHVQHIRRRVMTIVSSLQLLLLGLLVLLSPLVMGVWTAPHEELENDVLYNDNSNKKNGSSTWNELHSFSWRRLVQLAIIDNGGGGDASHRFGIQTYPNEINIKVCLLHAWFLFAFDLPFAIDFIIGLVHLAVAMAFYHYESSLTMLLIALWMSVPLINMIASCLIRVCCYCRNRHHHHHHYHNRTLDCKHDAPICTNASCWCDNSCNNDNKQKAKIINFITYESYMPSEDATNFTVYNNYANNITDNNTNNNVFDSKETNDPNTTTNQVSRTTHKSVLPGLHSRTVASQQQRHKAEYWDLDNCYNADEYDDQNDINSNTLPHYPVAQEITRTQQGANVFEENYNDHCNEEEAPYNTPIAYTNSREGSNIRATSTTTTITPLRYSPREKDELESITNNKSEQHNDNNIAENKYCGRAKLANSRNIKNKHKTHDKTIEPQKEKLHVKETKILKENTHAIGPEVLLSLHSERDRQSLIDFVVDKEIANLSYMFVDCDDAIIRLANSKFAECVGTVTSSLLLRRLHDVLIWLQVDQSDRVMSELEKIKMNMTEKQIAKAQSLSLLPTSSSSLSSTQQLKKHTLPITSNEPLTKFNQRASLPMSMRKNNEQESSELFVFCKRITLQGKCPYNVLSNVNKENNDYINNNANESDNIQTKINKVTTAKNVDATNTISESSAANKECVGNNNNSTINKVNTATDKLVLDRNKEMHHLIQEHWQHEEEKYTRPVFVIHLDVFLVQNQNLLNFKPCLLFHTPQYHEYCNALGLPVAILRASDGTIVFWSTSAAKYTGISESAILSFPVLAYFTPTFTADNANDLNDSMSSISSNNGSSNHANKDNNNNNKTVLRGKVVLPTRPYSKGLSTRTHPLCFACSLRVAKGEQASIEQERIKHEIDLRISHNYSYIKQKYSCQSGQDDDRHEKDSNINSAIPEWMRIPQLHTWAHTNSLLLLMLEEKVSNYKHDTRNHKFFDIVTNTKSLQKSEKLHERNDQELKQHSQEQELPLHKMKLSECEEDEEEPEDKRPTNNVSKDDEEDQEQTEIELEEESYILADGSSNDNNNDDDNDDDDDDQDNNNNEEEESEKSEEENLNSCIGSEGDKYKVDDQLLGSRENEHATVNKAVYNSTVPNIVIPTDNNYETDYDHQSNNKSVKSDAVVEEVMNASNYCEHPMRYMNEYDNITSNNKNNIYIWNEEVVKTTQLPDSMLHTIHNEENVITQIEKNSNCDDVKYVHQLPLANANMKSVESSYNNNNDNNYTQTTGTNRPRRQVLISPPIVEMNYSEAENEQVNNYNTTLEFMPRMSEEGRESNVMRKEIDAEASNNFSSQHNTVENAIRDEVLISNAPYTQSQIGDNALKYCYDSNSINNNKLDGNDGGGVRGKALDGKPPFVLPLAMVHLNSNNENNVILNTEQKNIYSASHIDNIEHNNIEDEEKINLETNGVNYAPHDGSEEVHAGVLTNPSTALTTTHVQEKQVTWGQLLSRDEGTIASCLIRTPLNEPFRFGRSSRCELCVHDSFVSSIQFTLTRTLRVHYKNESTTSLTDNKLADRNIVDDTNANNNAKEIVSRSFVVTLQDKSVNGTYVNVKKIGKDKTCVLHDGDLITFRLSTSQFFLGFVFRLLHYHKSAEHRTRKRKEITSSMHHAAPTSKYNNDKKEYAEEKIAAMLKRRESEAESPVSEMLAESLHSSFANGSKLGKEFNESIFNKKNNKLYDSTLHENQFNLSGIVSKDEHLPWPLSSEEEEEEELEKSRSAASAPATPATLPYNNNIHADSTNFAGTSQHMKNKKSKGNMKQSNGARSLSAFWVQRRLSLKRKVDHRRSASAHLNSRANHSASSAHGSNPEHDHTRHRTMSETQRPRHGWSDDNDNNDNNDEHHHHHVMPPVRDNLRLPLSRHDKRNTTLPRVDSDRLSNYKNSGSRASSSFTHSTYNNNNIVDSGVGEEVRIREITSSSPYIREYESAAKSGSSVYEARFSNSNGGGAAATPFHEQASSTSLSPSSSVEDYNSRYDDHEYNLEDEPNAPEHHARSRHGSDPYSTNHRHNRHRRRTGFRGNSSQDRYRSQPEDEYHHNNNNNSSSSNAGNNSYHESQYQNHNYHGHHHHHHRKRETIEWKIGEEMLGKGGNAEVYLGINLTNGQLIAVKRVLLPTAINDVQRDPATAKAILQQYRSLQEEINVLSKAIHPNIVRYYGSSQNKTYFNILLEFVPGGSLRHLLDNFGALSPGVIFSYLRQALEGLRYLHAREIVHGDIKTANILISEKGQAKLTDFGTARLLNRQHASMLLTSDNKSTERKDNNEELSLPSSSINRRLKEDDKENHMDINNPMSGGTVGTTLRLGGTLRWMDPALFRLPSHISANHTTIDNNSVTANNNNKLIKPASESPTPSRSGPNKASDIWSVGCALIEMMSGEGPWYEYEFESEEQIINLLRYTTEPPEIPECAECPELMTIAQSCLQLTPESRPTCEMLLLNVIAASERLQSQMQTPSASPARDSSGPLPNSSQFTDNASDNINNKSNSDKHNVNSKGTIINNIVETNVQNKSFRSQSHKSDINDINNGTVNDDDDDNIDSRSNNKEKKLNNVYIEAVHDVKSTFNQSEGAHDNRNELESSNNMENQFAAKD